MQMLIRHHDGRRQEAMLLSASAGTLRIATPGCDDATELKLRQGQWLGESNRPVEIEFIGAHQPLAAGMWMTSLPVLAERVA